MILDERLELADATALQTSDNSTETVTGDVIDLGTTSNYPGHGENIRIVCYVDTAVTSSSTANVTFKVKSDSTADLATSATTHFTTAAIAKATLIAGYKVFDIVLPGGTYERYLGVTHTPDTTTLTAGKVNIFLVKDSREYVNLPDAL